VSELVLRVNALIVMFVLTEFGAILNSSSTELVQLLLSQTFVRGMKQHLVERRLYPPVEHTGGLQLMVVKSEM